MLDAPGPIELEVSTKYLNTTASLPCDSMAFAELSTQMLQLGKHLRFRASGSSMQPMVRDGDILLIAPYAETKSIKIGDVVLSTIDPERVVVHRVVRRQSGRRGYRYLLQGDYASRPDGWVSQTNLFGSLVEIEREDQKLRLDQPAARILGWLFTLRARSGFGKTDAFRTLKKKIKNNALFSDYLT